MRRSLLLACGVVLVAGVVVPLAAGGPGAAPKGRWVARDLGVLDGGSRFTSSYAQGINERGQVVGSSSGPPDEYGHSVHRAFVWQNGKMRDLGTLGGENGTAVAINDRGQIVGNADTNVPSGDEDRRYHAFLWENGKMRDLGTLGCCGSEAIDINESGQVVGAAGTKSGWEHAFLWERGRMRDLGTLGGTWSRAETINDRGQILGTGLTKADRVHVFLWENGRMIDLGPRTPGGAGCSDVSAASNDRGQIVATLYTGRKLPIGGGDFSKICHVYRLQAGKWQDLTPGDLTSTASGINNRGQIVGAVETKRATADYRAALWENGKASSLPYGLSHSEASAINDRGQIVGWAGAQTHAFLWTWQPTK